MKTCHAAKVLTAFSFLLGSSAYGAQPPNVVSSDGNTNTAMGTGALFNLTTGFENTAAGWQTLYSTTSGYQNTALGVNALPSNTVGYQNTAVGGFALNSNTTGSSNSAFGSGALANNATGSGNHAFGINALGANTTGDDNSAHGTSTLAANTTGNVNSAFGNFALGSNTTGSSNTATGFGALGSNTTGSNNTALGYSAGSNVTGGSNNIDIANPGVADDGGTIRIGTSGQQVRAFVAGIWGHYVGRGAAVLINSKGQLGVEESSERYKTDITSADVSSEKLQQLRPVTYRFKTDSTGDRHYGLIAEEVDKVYPDLVVRDDAGNIEGVRYDELTPILLGEIQQQRRRLDNQAAQIEELNERLAKLQH
jgi:hypothetical protein